MGLWEAGVDNWVQHQQPNPWRIKLITARKAEINEIDLPSQCLLNPFQCEVHGSVKSPGMQVASTMYFLLHKSSLIQMSW